MSFIIGGQTLVWSPSEDTEWVAEVVTGEQHAPTATFSIIQNGGLKSARREIKGIIKSKAMRDAIEAMKGTIVSITDTYGTSYSVWIESLTWNVRTDASNSPYYRAWEYDLKMVKR
jgi:hypothetical protein